MTAGGNPQTEKQDQEVSAVVAVFRVWPKVFSLVVAAA